MDPKIRQIWPVQPQFPLTGIGFDVHAFAASDSERELHIAGLFWPDQTGLVGHSDGDVAAHAAADALLSAAGLGDLGTQIGTSDPMWKGTPGVELLAEMARRVRLNGFIIGNVAIQIIGSRPKIGTRRAEAEAALSAAAQARITIAATTTDGLGFAGRDEGLAALATALVMLDPAPPASG